MLDTYLLPLIFTYRYSMIIVAQLTFQKILAMVVAQLVELSLPTAEFDGSNPIVIVGNLY